MNNRTRRLTQQTRLVATALIEHDERLLLTQLAKGRFAGFWLLPSASVEQGTVAETARRMVYDRTGYPVVDQRLRCVLEEPQPEVLTLRFAFAARVGERDAAVADPEIVQARWFTRDAVRELLEERDVVPTLGVMSLLRAWVEGTALDTLELVIEDAQCPCGSGFRYLGCCGWDAR